MGEVAFATSLHVGICRMGTNLFGDDVAQKYQIGSCEDILHQGMFIGSSCLHWADM